MHYFISGIDTDCGKTYVTGHLAKELMRRGERVITLKPVQTGCKEIAEDIVEHRRLMGIGLLPEDRDGSTCSYLFGEPVSPHLAARLEGVTIDADKLRRDALPFTRSYDVTLIEGAGGLMVPITDSLLTVDYVKESGYKLILVCSSKLGSINHALLSIDCCANRGIAIHTIIYNRFSSHSSLMATETLSYIKRYAATVLPSTRVVCLEDGQGLEAFSH